MDTSEHDLNPAYKTSATHPAGFPTFGNAPGYRRLRRGECDVVWQMARIRSSGSLTTTAPDSRLERTHCRFTASTRAVRRRSCGRRITAQRTGLRMRGPTATSMTFRVSSWEPERRFALATIPLRMILSYNWMNNRRSAASLGLPASASSIPTIYRTILASSADHHRYQ